MALISLVLPPGLYANGTLYQAKGRYHAANLMRFSQDEVKPIGGWQVRSPAAPPFAGAARAVMAWTDNSQSRWIAVGTHAKLYVQNEAGGNTEITPVQPLGRTLGANPLSATSGSAVVTVTDPGHGAQAGDVVVLSGAAAFGGLPVEVLDQPFKVLASPAPTATTYAVNVGSNAGSTTSGGGSAMTAAYGWRQLGSAPLATTNGSTVITVTHNGHGAVAGDFVTLSGATAFNGLTADQLNRSFQILAQPDPTTNTYAVDVGATSSATGAGGGASVRASYPIHTGLADATQNLGYGGGPYGANNYGAPRPYTVAFLPATVWTLDSWGEHLVACNDHDGNLYEWALDTSVPAQAIPGAPSGCTSLVVTGEGFLFALGAGGDGRKVQWCEQQDDSTWTPDATNQAGDFDLATAGVLMAGRALTGQTLLLTDVDAWTASYIGAPLVYGFQRVGSGCGLIAKGAVAALDAEAAWMGAGGFWLFDGQAARPLDCEVADAVFGNMNPDQASKVTAVLLGGPGEVWWFYPSEGSIENDRYVAWAFRESRRLGRNIWTIGELTRLGGVGKSVGRTPPLMVDQNGYLYEHETGLDFQADGAELWPFLETGPIELGPGDGLMEIQRIIPDERNAGDVQVSLIGRMWPNGEDLDLGTYSLSSPTDLLAQAREIRLRYTAARLADFRIGGFRLDVVQGDRE